MRPDTPDAIRPPSTDHDHKTSFTQTILCPRTHLQGPPEDLIWDPCRTHLP